MNYNQLNHDFAEKVLGWKNRGTASCPAWDMGDGWMHFNDTPDFSQGLHAANRVVLEKLSELPEWHAHYDGKNRLHFVHAGATVVPYGCDESFLRAAMIALVQRAKLFKP